MCYNDCIEEMNNKAESVIEVMKKKKIVIFAVAFVLVALAIYIVFAYQHNKAYDGATVKSREILLDQAIGESKSWTIATEREIEGYIVSGAYSTNNQAAVAVFEPIREDGYKLMTTTSRSSDEIIDDAVLINGVSYQLIWFHGAQTEYAEIVYTIDGQAQETRKHRTADMEIICEKAPAKEYTMEIAYYDSEGNKYT